MKLSAPSAIARASIAKTPALMTGASRQTRRPLPGRVCVLACVALSLSAPAQEFPSKPVHIVLEYGAGAGGDTFLRTLAPQVSTALGQTIVLDNRPGAGGMVAAEVVIRSAPDGYTLLAASQNAAVTRRFLSKSSQVDFLKDLVPVTALWKSTSVVVANTSVPANSLSELIAYARANPGKLSYGSTGIGTQGHFAGEEINLLAGINVLHVPYKGTGQAVQETMTGQLSFAISIMGTVAPYLKSGKLRVLGIIGDQRLASMPDVPVVSETVQGFEPPPSWTGIFAPAGIPEPILQKLSKSIAAALRSPEAAKRSGSLGFELVGSSPQDFSVQIRREIDLVGRIVKAARIEPTD